MNNEEIFIKAKKALAEGNYEEFIEHCAEDINWINVGGSIFNGKTEILKYISSSYNDIKFYNRRSYRRKRYRHRVWSDRF
jgi:hypothetical protein